MSARTTFLRLAHEFEDEASAFIDKGQTVEGRAMLGAARAVKGVIAAEDERVARERAKARALAGPPAWFVVFVVGALLGLAALGVLVGQ